MPDTAGDVQRQQTARNVELAMSKCGASTAATLDAVASRDPFIGYVKGVTSMRHARALFMP